MYSIHHPAKCLLVTALAALAPLLAAAAGAAEDGIDEVVVTATRIPTARSDLAASADVVVVGDAARGFQGLDFAEALEAVPGLFVQARHNSAQDLRIDLRGFGARGNFGIRGLRIFVDGLPESLPDGQAQVDSVDAADIQSVEILRGPAAALYGNAAGGVILIRTLPASQAPPWRLSYGLGAYGFGKTGAGIRFAGPGPDDALRLSVSRQKTDGYREQSSSESKRLSASLQKELGARDTLSVALRVTDAPLAEDPGGLNFTDFAQDPARAATNNVFFNAGEVLDQQSLAWRWERSLGEAAGLELSNYFTWRDFENRLPFVSGGAVVLARKLAGASAQYRWEGNAGGRWVAGASLDRQEDDRRRFDNEGGERTSLRLDQLEQVTAAGAFLGADYPLPSGLGLQAGIRYDHLRFALEDRFLSDGDDAGARRFHRFSQSLGLHLDAGEAVDLYARYATSFETPTTTELANPDGGGFNAGLEPQQAKSWEFGMVRRSSAPLRGTLELAAYQVDVEDELVAFELPGRPGRSFFENAGKSRRRGIELSVAMAAGEAIRARVSTAWTRSVFERFVLDGEDFAGRRLPGTPGLRMAGSLDWKLGQGWSLGVDAERVWRVFADNANTVRSPDYLDVGLRLALRKKLNGSLLESWLGVRNLLDEAYTDNLRINAFGGRFFEPAPPRYLHAGVRLSGLGR